ncbi:MAG TPA: serine/threonine-protein kinase [Pirellulales bacterium]|jgi:serine/threonine-protein kinase|nr:serine/threonine-protein kinase [Pirellulales bacterium]
MLLPDRYQVAGDALDGGMGSVIPCKDTVLSRDVAIKVLQSGTEHRRILDEIAALLKMRSKHVVQVYDVLDLPGGKMGIVQEFIEGKDLLKRATIAASKADYYKQLWQIASGISDIHAVGVIHRDIKPNNMKIDPEGVIKIFDFGLARDEGEDAATAGFIGTHGFAAPELYKGSVSFTKAIDTYAFGATAYFLGARLLPASLRNKPPTPVKADCFDDLPFELPPDISFALHGCLAHDPRKRPQMSDVRDMLARHLLAGRHKALLVYNGSPNYLNADNRSVNLRLKGMGQIEISYDDLDYRIVSVSGDVAINNRIASAGDVLPGSCVIALGSPAMKAQRRYITFDLSHPEIVL